MTKKIITASLLLLAATSVEAQIDTTTRNRTLEEVSIQQRKTEGLSRMGGAVNGTEMGQGELSEPLAAILAKVLSPTPQST